MSLPTSRETLKEYCLRNLGAPVVEINYEDGQLDDRIDEAFQEYRKFHYDATEQAYLRHTITQDDISNTYIIVPDSIIGITKVLPLNSASTTISPNYMFDPYYQMRISDLQQFTDMSLISYEILGQYISTLKYVLSPLPEIRFNRHTNKLYLDINWSTRVTVGDTLIIVCDMVLDPDAYRDVYRDNWLLKYTTALFKRQWATNLSKFDAVQLPGGITMNGLRIYEDAIKDIVDLELELRDTYELPMMMISG